MAYDFSDPNRSRLLLSSTLQLASPTRFQAGTAVTAIDTFTKPLSSLTVLDAVDTTKAYTGRLVLARETQFLGAEALLKAGFQFDQRTKMVEREVDLAQASTAAQFATIGIGRPTIQPVLARSGVPRQDSDGLHLPLFRSGENARGIRRSPRYRRAGHNPTTATISTMCASRSMPGT